MVPWPTNNDLERTQIVKVFGTGEIACFATYMVPTSSKILKGQMKKLEDSEHFDFFNFWPHSVACNHLFYLVTRDETRLFTDFSVSYHERRKNACDASAVDEPTGSRHALIIKKNL